MKAAPERPFSPVFCLHGPTEESGEGSANPDLYVSMAGEAGLAPHRLSTCRYLNFEIIPFYT